MVLNPSMARETNSSHSNDRNSPNQGKQRRERQRKNGPRHEAQTADSASKQSTQEPRQPREHRGHSEKRFPKFASISFVEGPLSITDKPATIVASVAEPVLTIAAFQGKTPAHVTFTGATKFPVRVIFDTGFQGDCLISPTAFTLAQKQGATFKPLN